METGGIKIYEEDLVQGELSVRRGDIIMAEYFFNGSWRQKPVLIVQNDIGNSVSPLVIVVPIVAADGKGAGPMQVDLDEKLQAETGLKKSTILLNIILTLEKNQLREKIGRLPNFLFPAVEKGLLISLGFSPIKSN